MINLSKDDRGAPGESKLFSPPPLSQSSAPLLIVFKGLLNLQMMVRSPIPTDNKRPYSDAVTHSSPCSGVETDPTPSTSVFLHSKCTDTGINERTQSSSSWEDHDPVRGVMGVSKKTKSSSRVL